MKLYCNRICRNVFKKHVLKKSQSTPQTWNLYALDDEHFQSTLSILQDKTLPTDTPYRVYLAQHDRSTFRKMISKWETIGPEMDSLCDNMSIRFGEFGCIEPNNEQIQIHLDHADFCSGWKKNKHILQDRFRCRKYADRAVIRLTISYRGTGLRADQHATMVLEDMYDFVRHTPYMIKTCTLKQMDSDFLKHDYTEDDADADNICYGTMQTFVFCVYNVEL